MLGLAWKQKIETSQDESFYQPSLFLSFLLKGKGQWLVRKIDSSKAGFHLLFFSASPEATVSKLISQPALHSIDHRLALCFFVCESVNGMVIVLAGKKSFEASPLPRNNFLSFSFLFPPFAWHS